MTNATKVTGAAIATAAALLFGSMAVTTANAEEAKVKCEGVNACNGTSACATATNACQGQNGCKGHGYLMLTKAECDAAKAKMKEEKKSRCPTARQARPRTGSAGRCIVQRGHDRLGGGSHGYTLAQDDDLASRRWQDRSLEPIFLDTLRGTWRRFMRQHQHSDRSLFALHHEVRHEMAAKPAAGRIGK